MGHHVHQELYWQQVLATVLPKNSQPVFTHVCNTESKPVSRHQLLQS